MLLAWSTPGAPSTATLPEETDGDRPERSRFRGGFRPGRDRFDQGWRVGLGLAIPGWPHGDLPEEGDADLVRVEQEAEVRGGVDAGDEAEDAVVTPGRVEHRPNGGRGRARPDRDDERSRAVPRPRGERRLPRRWVAARCCHIAPRIRSGGSGAPPATGSLGAGDGTTSSSRAPAASARRSWSRIASNAAARSAASPATVTTPNAARLSHSAPVGVAPSSTSAGRGERPRRGRGSRSWGLTSQTHPVGVATHGRAGGGGGPSQNTSTTCAATWTVSGATERAGAARAGARLASTGASRSRSSSSAGVPGRRSSPSSGSSASRPGQQTATTTATTRSTARACARGPPTPASSGESTKALTATPTSMAAVSTSTSSSRPTRRPAARVLSDPSSTSRADSR